MPNNRKQRKRSNRGKRSQRGNSGMLVQQVLNRAQRFIFRYQNTAAGQTRVNFVRAQMLGIWCLNSSTTVQYPLIGSLHIRRLKIIGTAIADTGGAAGNNVIDLIWGGGIFGDNIVINSVSNSFTRLPYIDSTPPRNSSASFVTTIAGVNSSVAGTGPGQGAEVLFSIVSITGTYVELHADVVFNDTPTTLSITTTALTQGVPWWNPLDNQFLTGAAAVFDPIGHRNFSNT